MAQFIDNFDFKLPSVKSAQTSKAEIAIILSSRELDLIVIALAETKKIYRESKCVSPRTVTEYQKLFNELHTVAHTINPLES